MSLHWLTEPLEIAWCSRWIKPMTHINPHILLYCGQYHRGLFWSGNNLHEATQLGENRVYWRRCLQYGLPAHNDSALVTEALNQFKSQKTASDDDEHPAFLHLIPPQTTDSIITSIRLHTVNHVINDQHWAGLSIVPVVPREGAPHRQGAPDQLPNVYHAVLTFERAV